MAEDVISRQAAIDRINRHKAYMEEHNDVGESLEIYLLAHDHICEAISMLPPAQQWISCNERLPEEDDDYLVTVDDEDARFVAECSYDSIFGWGFYSDVGDEFLEISNVIAWQPLPEPYKEGDHT